MCQMVDIEMLSIGEDAIVADLRVRLSFSH